MNWEALSVSTLTLLISSLLVDFIRGGTVERRVAALGDAFLFLVFIPINYCIWESIVL